MLYEITVGLESWVAGVFDSLAKHPVVQRFLELQLVLRQVEVNILCHVQAHQRAVLGLHVVEDDFVAVANDGLHEKAGYVRCLRAEG